MMRLTTLLTFFLFCAVAALAQQRPLQSLYMFDPLLVNPAYAGTQVQLSATAIYRNQWVNLEGAPKTFTSTIHSGFKKTKMGLGVIIANDQIGIHNDLSFYGVYSYKLQVSRKGTLSMGIQGGFNNIKSDYTKLNLKAQNDPNLSGQLTKMNPNVGGGIFYYQKDFYAGFSVPQIINNSVFDLEGNGSLSKQLRYYYVFAGFSRSITHNFKVMPSTLIRAQEEAPISFDLNTTFVLHDVVGLGVSYRLNEGIVGLFELQINENFHVGYAYDFTTSALNQFSNGSHEIMINYRVKISRWHQGLACPAYW
ncbi:MAG TPA: type IX secretion system membrane protein PorP/SprF [Cyclobacteriaceae bacterium]|nr:type IX secretion system membrane protein PorP/SprF [Cyclobacteriaceae bacterium]